MNPSSLPESLYRAAEVRELDRVAIEEFDIPGLQLMERAAAACLGHLQRSWPHAGRVAVLCGHGNNGGDGFLIARGAHRAGLAVDVHLVGRRDRLAGDAERAFQRLGETGLSIGSDRSERGGSRTSVDPCDSGTSIDLGRADVVVDAMLGSGLDREVAGRWADAIGAVNASQLPVLAVDIPSGLHADTGRRLGTAIEAALTVTFIGLKRGLFTASGRAACGQVVFDDLQIPSGVYRAVRAEARRMQVGDFADALPPRGRDAHKGSFGHTLVIGGDIGYAGAARLAAESAARTGSGLVTVATRPEHATTVCADRPEIMVRGVQDRQSLAPLIEAASVLAVGPGLGRSDWGQALLDAALASRRPMVIDADALNLLAARADGVRRHPLGHVLTPHPGEAGRLLGSCAADVEQDRFAAASALQRRYGGVVVLKGAGTLVDDGAAPISVCDAGNPGMATAGMGDVLCGIIAGLIAQGSPPALAARLGVCVHAEAGDRAARAGERGLLAGDLLAHVRAVVNRAPGPPGGA